MSDSSAHRYSLHQRSLLRPALLSVAIAGLFTSHAVAAELPAVVVDPAAAAVDPAPSGGSVNFDAAFFPAGMAPKVDLSRFEKSGYVAPGTYHGDIVVNKEWRAHADIVYANTADDKSTVPCFDTKTLLSYGIDMGKVAKDADHPPKMAAASGSFCGNLGDYIPGASASFDAESQSITFTVPQIYLSHSARGWVDPSQWDPGINSTVLNYNANAYSTHNRTGSDANGYLGLNASVNFGSWHLNQLSSLSFTEGGHSRYQNAATYIQHDIPSLGAQFVAGDTFTPGDMFDSVRVRGVRLYSDDRMLPQSLRGYAPVVHGLAETNAHIIVRQRGYIIYEINVAPGPFSIDDLYPTGYGGDLDVQVIEADGRTKQFSVPYSAVTQLLRPGLSRWSITAGKVDEMNFVDQPNLVQGTYQRGLTNLMTGYAGATLATGYRSALVGGALNTDVGAFSMDITEARDQVPGQAATSGLSTRLGYNKNFVDTGTNFAVAAYRYSTPGYVDLLTATQLRNAVAQNQNPSGILRQRSRADISINQTLGERTGQLFLTGSVSNYWNQGGKQVDFSAGYSNQWHGISYNLSAQRTRDSVQSMQTAGLVNQIPGEPDSYIPSAAVTRRDTRIYLTVSVPLGKSARAPMFNTLLSHSQQSGNTEQVSVSGSVDKDSRLTYGASASHAPSDNTFSINSQYASSSGNITGGYSQGSGYHQFSAGMSGGVIVHRNGAVWSPPLGDTVGLVYAPDARGATIQNSRGSVVDINGYAAVPYLMPYELNAVTVDPKGAGAGVTFNDNMHSVAPRAGSVVLLKFNTASGHAILVDTSLPDGRPVPFGADVLDSQGNKVGVAGQASRLFINGLKNSGAVTVRWGDHADESCKIDIRLPSKAKKGGDDYDMLKLACGRVDTASTLPHATNTQASLGSAVYLQAPMPSVSATESYHSPLLTQPYTRLL